MVGKILSITWLAFASVIVMLGERPLVDIDSILLLEQYLIYLMLLIENSFEQHILLEILSLLSMVWIIFCVHLVC